MNEFARAVAIEAANHIFKNHPYSLSIGLREEKCIITISYEDFIMESVVQREMSYLMGIGYEIVVVRRYSEKVIKDFLYEMYSDTGTYGRAFRFQVNAAISYRQFR